MDEITFNNLKDLYENYKGKKCDDAFFRKATEIYNNDSFIDNIVDVVDCNDYENLCINSQTFELLYNKEAYPRTCDKYTSAFIKQYPNNYLEIYNIFYLHFILHEFEHVKQGLYASYNLSEYDALNELYRLLNYMCMNTSERRLNKYFKNGADYCFERNANIEASKIVYDIVDSDMEHELVKVNYLLDLMCGYEVKRRKIVCPVNETFKKYGFGKYKVLYDEDIPFEVAFSHGLPVDPSKLIEFYKLLDTPTLESVDYEAQKKLMKSL